MLFRDDSTPVSDLVNAEWFANVCRQSQLAEGTHDPADRDAVQETMQSLHSLSRHGSREETFDAIPDGSHDLGQRLLWSGRRG